MNKKEQGIYNEAILRASINRALRWSERPVKKDVEPPTSMDYSSGWTAHSYQDRWRVGEGWSSAVSHGDGAPPKQGVYGGGSQQPARMYSTRLLALRAVRCEMEERFACALAEVDREINEEVSK